MPSYLATIRYEADDWDSAEVKVMDALVATGGDRFRIRPGYEMPGDDQGYRCSFKTLKDHSAVVVPCGASAKYRDLPDEEPSTLCDEHYERVMRVSAPAETTAAVRALSPAVVEELRQMMVSVAENRWDFFTHSEAFRGYIEIKAEGAVRAALMAQLERQRRIP